MKRLKDAFLILLSTEARINAHSLNNAFGAQHDPSLILQSCHPVILYLIPNASSYELVGNRITVAPRIGAGDPVA